MWNRGSTKAQGKGVLVWIWSRAAYLNKLLKQVIHTGKAKKAADTAFLYEQIMKSYAVLFETH